MKNGSDIVDLSRTVGNWNAKNHAHSDEIEVQESSTDGAEVVGESMDEVTHTFVI